MKNSKEIKTRKLLIALNNWFEEVSYDALGEIVIRGTERDCYNSIMKNEEFHSLGAKFIKEMIHVMFTDCMAFLSLTYKYNNI